MFEVAFVFTFHKTELNIQDITSCNYLNTLREKSQVKILTHYQGIL